MEKRRPAAPFVLPGGMAKAAMFPGGAGLGALLRPVAERRGVPVLPGGGSSQSAGPPGFGAEPTLIHEPGGDVVRELVHPNFSTFQELYRVLPEESWFDPTLTPSKPVQFELGAFTVPADQHLWIFDYRFQVYRQSGIDPGDMVPAEDGRFSGCMGFDVKLNDRRPSHLLYQLDPVPVQFQRQTFDTPPGLPANQSQFNRSSAQSFASTASPGLSLLPVWSLRQGARNAPFTIVAQQGDRVALSCVIFKTITSPITCIEGFSAGFLVHALVSSAILQRLRPR